MPKNERLLAFPNVKIFKPNLQGKADSLSTRTADSLIYLYDDPVLWSDNNQMESDTISIVVSNGNVDKMFMDTNAFVTSHAVDEYYNQVKGRNMIVFFKEAQIRQVDVNGNGESVYFELHEEDSLIMGMNKVICSDMRLKFEQSKIKDITFYSPDGSFVPFHEIRPEAMTLENFSWRAYERPTRNSVVGVEVNQPPAPFRTRSSPVDISDKPPPIGLDRLQEIN